MMIIGDGGHAKVMRDVLEEFDAAGTFVAIGDNAARKKEAEKIKEVCPAVVARGAYVASDVPIGAGTIVMRGAIVQTGSKIGRFCIINTGATVDHDCVICDYVHIAPGAHLCGHVEVGEGSLIGVGVGIAPMCKIPPWTLVKARRLEMVPLYD